MSQPRIHIEEEFLRQLNDHLGIIHKICRLYFPDQEEDRKDLYQEVLYQSWKSYPHFREEARFSTWLYKIALNTAITFFRKSKRQPDRPATTGLLPDTHASPDLTARQENRELMMRALQILSPVDKAVVSLYLDEFPYEEIARLIGMSKSNVSVRLVRIRQQLAEKLNQKL